MERCTWEGLEMLLEHESDMPGRYSDMECSNCSPGKAASNLQLKMLSGIPSTLTVGPSSCYNISAWSCKAHWNSLWMCATHSHSTCLAPWNLHFQKQASKLLTRFFLIKISSFLTSWNARQLKHSYPQKTTVHLQSNRYLHSSSHPKTKQLPIEWESLWVSDMADWPSSGTTKDVQCHVIYRTHVCSWCNNLGVEEGVGKGVCLFARGAFQGQI